MEDRETGRRQTTRTGRRNKPEKEQKSPSTHTHAHSSIPTAISSPPSAAPSTSGLTLSALVLLTLLPSLVSFPKTPAPSTSSRLTLSAVANPSRTLPRFSPTFQTLLTWFERCDERAERRSSAARGEERRRGEGEEDGEVGSSRWAEVCDDEREGKR